MLGSRANLCINPAVNQLRSNNLMNERCLELRQSKSRTKQVQDDEEEELAKKKARKKGKCDF